MNLNQKEKLKARLDDLTALISCIDDSWYVQHTQINVSQISATLFQAMNHMTMDDDFVTMTILLKMIKFQITKIRLEYEP